MKILHTADWHLGKKLDHFQRLPEQREVLEEIIFIADEQQVDVVLIAGDIFDAFNPPTEAVELFYKTIKKLSNNGKRPVVLIAGNHDSPDRIDLPSPLANECGIIAVGYPNATISAFKLDSGLEVTTVANGFFELKIPKVNRALRIIHAAYANEYRLKQFLGTENKEEELEKVLEQNWKNLADTYCNQNGVNIFMAHLFFIKKGEKPPAEPDDEKSILHVGGVPALATNSVPEAMDYAALGHLHRGYTVDDTQCPVVYSGSPLCYSFAEAHQEKSVVILTFNEDKELKTDRVPLKSGKKLLRKKFERLDAAVEWLKENQNALVEITLVIDAFLTSEDRRLLNETHNGIVAVIPQLREEGNEENKAGEILLEQDINDLFSQYFQYKTGQPINEEIKNLFKEITALEKE